MAPSWLNHPASHWPTFTSLVRDESGLLEYLGRHPAQRNLRLVHGFTTSEIGAEGMDVLWKAYEWANDKAYPRKLALVFWPMWRSHCANLYRRRTPPLPVDDSDILRAKVPATHATWESDDMDALVEALPEDLRELARLLSQGYTPEETIAALGISRSTYYHRRNRLKKLLSDVAHLDDEQ